MLFSNDLSMRAALLKLKNKIFWCELFSSQRPFPISTRIHLRVYLLGWLQQRLVTMQGKLNIHAGKSLKRNNC